MVSINLYNCTLLYFKLFKNFSITINYNKIGKIGCFGHNSVFKKHSIHFKKAIKWQKKGGSRFCPISATQKLSGFWQIINYSYVSPQGLEDMKNIKRTFPSNVSCLEEQTIYSVINKELLFLIKHLPYFMVIYLKLVKCEIKWCFETNFSVYLNNISIIIIHCWDYFLITINRTSATHLLGYCEPVEKSPEEDFIRWKNNFSLERI